MKKLLSFLLIIITGICIWQKDIIARFLWSKVIYRDAIVINKANKYYKIDDFKFVQNTNNFIVKNKDEFSNIIYTILNNGWNEFTFFCDYKYDTCIDDFNEFINDNSKIEAINNYIDPLNSYNSISFVADNLGKIKISITKNYNEKQIEEIEEEINQFINKNIKATMDDKQKIKLFHDYLADKTVYDTNFNSDMDKEIYTYHPYIAYGPIIENLGICSGYSDAMAIFLNKIGVKNYKISNSEHIWNLIYLNSKWYHLDLTWDDPVLTNGDNVILYDFYLITTDELISKNTNQHTFNKEYYLEA